YRQNRRAAETGDGELVSRRDSAPLPTRSPGLSPLSRRREPAGAPARAAKLRSLDLQGLPEPVFGSSGWSEAGGSASMADHPLLRGLLMELPARGTMPASDWL